MLETSCHQTGRIAAEVSAAMQQSATKSDLRRSQGESRLAVARGTLCRSLSHVGGYRDGVSADAENSYRVPGNWTSFGRAGGNDIAPRRSGHGDRVPSFRFGGTDPGKLVQYDRIAALHRIVQWGGKHGRYDRAPDGGIGRRRYRQRGYRTRRP